MFTAKKLHTTKLDEDGEVKGYYAKINGKHHIIIEGLADAENIDLEYCPGGYNTYLGIDLADIPEIDISTLKYIGEDI